MTFVPAPFVPHFTISTHTPLARRDEITMLRIGVSALFLLTRLSQGVTRSVSASDNAIDISTHTPLARRDFHPRKLPKDINNFYSHASRKA